MWARRNDDAPAMAGFHVGPGGLTESVDAEAPADASPDGRAGSRVCALRELFEEVGILHAHGAEAIDRATHDELRDLLRDEPAEGHARFAALGLRWRTAELVHIGCWITPEHVHARRRFEMDLFVLPMDHAPAPEPSPAELAEAEWIEPRAALARWGRAEVAIAPPMIHLYRSLRSVSRSIRTVCARCTGPRVSSRCAGRWCRGSR